MANLRLGWDEESKRLYETGVDHGVLYVLGTDGYTTGVAWDGLTGVTESPDGADANDIYADNIKYLSLISEENWKATIKAYTYPIAFNACMGNASLLTKKAFFGQQLRSKFGFSWRSLVGNDTLGTKFGYKIHLAYGLSAAPSEMDHATTNDSPEAQEFSWEINSIPASVNDSIYIHGGKQSANTKILKPVAHITILRIPENESVTKKAKFDAIEDKLYGTQNTDPELPTIDSLINFLKLGSWS